MYNDADRIIDAYLADTAMKSAGVPREARLTVLRAMLHGTVEDPAVATARIAALEEAVATMRVSSGESGP